MTLSRGKRKGRERRGGERIRGLRPEPPGYFYIKGKKYEGEPGKELCKEENPEEEHFGS